MRHVMTKCGLKGFIPVGFSIVFYNPNEPNPKKKWFHDVRSIIKPTFTEEGGLYLQDDKMRERIADVNQFLAHGIKKVLEGEIEDRMLKDGDIEGFAFQIPGMKGKA